MADSPYTNPGNTDVDSEIALDEIDLEDVRTFEPRELDVEEFKSLLPQKHRKLVTKGLVEELNSWNRDPRLMDTFRENLMGYSNILHTQGADGLQRYVNAVKFVSYKLLNYKDIDAYMLTFPDRYKRLKSEGVSRPEMGAYVTAYKRTAMVTKVLEQTIVPTHILNAPLYQKALNTLALIMVEGKSEMARVQAATTILSNTKPPESMKIELDIGVKDNGAITALREATEELARQQRLSIEAGVAVKTIAESTIIDAEVDENGE